ncbi:CDP-glucose 4,6-dehydratase [Granulicella mallensis]|uniref:CDP-glucose 4,6-dehydratase n=1 Tax=Granulicella mallensis TaxID=940614 RepID=A0A7W7ZKR4_9BACT|nr:CDP-glucose 4,6-dehydratase [Granulicella mallensis]MBB5061687.1 CDP-glucose 4,6-dehydratase [Granulicella mallensis]
MSSTQNATPTSTARPNLWQGKRVFLTGHTGFKGGWLALWLASKGAIVRGYALDPSTEPNLFTAAKIGSVIEDIRGDIRDSSKLEPALRDFAPEVVFHLAAQPLVRYSYEDPIGTYETNVIGTARVLDTVRRTPSVRAVVSVTTDKCYENKEWLWGYRETDPLGGYDPYSSSKACAEIVSAAYRQSYFPVSKLAEHQCALATGRAGNVIGGGDWSLDRLIPDLVRGFLVGEPVLIRRPHAIRPWQHVLEPLLGYILLAEHLLTHDPRYATAFNFGPSDDDAQEVGWIVERMTQFWGGNASWKLDEDPGVHEAGYLKLDASRARAELAWHPRLRLETTLHWLVDWYKAWQSGEDMHRFTLDQISAYEKLSPAR